MSVGLFLGGHVNNKFLLAAFSIVCLLSPLVLASQDSSPTNNCQDNKKWPLVEISGRVYSQHLTPDYEILTLKTEQASLKNLLIKGRVLVVVTHGPSDDNGTASPDFLGQDIRVLGMVGMVNRPATRRDITVLYEALWHCLFTQRALGFTDRPEEIPHLFALKISTPENKNGIQPHK
jgi:hypothetical protein